MLVHFGSEISQQPIGVKFGADIRGSKLIYRNDFGDPPTFPLVPP